MPETVMVGLSGGVDSAVACKLLLEQNFKVEALFMKNWEEDDVGECSAAQDLKDAKQAADKLRIPLHTVNFSHEYWEQVFSHFLTEYEKGHTPNPDVLCNREIKFKAFLDHAKKLGADKIATGHYARIRKKSGRYHLLKGIDKKKDQSYFLHLLNQQQLVHVIFPLGKYYKNDVRNIAQKSGFANFAKKDSTGICFIGARNFKNFITKYIPAQPGDILDDHGKKIGRHDGIMYYTLGQRKGINIGGLRDFAEAPWYVIDKKIKSNELIVSQNKKHPLLLANKITVENPHFITTPPVTFYDCSAKIRHTPQDLACKIQSVDRNEMVVTVEPAQTAVTPGQSLVIYDNNECLGGGVIKHKELV